MFHGDKELCALGYCILPSANNWMRLLIDGLFQLVNLLIGNNLYAIYCLVKSSHTAWVCL